MISNISLFAMLAFAGVALGEQCFCPMAFSPICASNGVIFSNKCMMKCFNFNHNSNLEEVTDGRCHNHGVVKPREQMANRCFCPMVFSPVCASNGQTFVNQCLLKCHNKDTNEDLKMVSKGKCAQASVTSVNSEEEIKEFCLCSEEYAPICGTNMKTYKNKCIFNCAAKKDNGLKFFHRGRCVIMS